MQKKRERRIAHVSARTYHLYHPPLPLIVPPHIVWSARGLSAWLSPFVQRPWPPKSTCKRPWSSAQSQTSPTIGVRELFLVDCVGFRSTLVAWWAIQPGSAFLCIASPPHKHTCSSTMSQLHMLTYCLSVALDGLIVRPVPLYCPPPIFFGWKRQSFDFHLLYGLLAGKKFKVLYNQFALLYVNETHAMQTRKGPHGIQKKYLIQKNPPKHKRI